MSEVIGKGVIEVSADATKLTAGIDEAKRSLKGLGVAAGEATKSQGASIDRYIKQLGVAAVTTGKTTRELELYKLALRGATAEQLRVADSALKMTEGYERGIKVGNQLKTGFLALGAAAATGLIAAYVAFNQLVKKAGDFQDMAEKTGDTAENIASLAVAAATAGTSMDSIVGAASKLTKGLTGVDDESKAAGAAIAALGLDLTAFKQLAPADQLETVAKALGGFQDGAQKSAVAMALFGKAGAELMPFLKELGQEGGRQVFLTQEQITLADAYADKQAKQRAELGLTAAAIASRMLPAYTALTGALNDAGKEMLGVGKASTDLSENHGVENFAENAINALAFVADAVNGVVTIFARTGEFLGASGAAIVAKVTGDTAGLKTIQDAYNESLDRGSVSFRALYQNRLAAQKQEAEIARGRGIKADEMGSWDTKPVLKFGGAVKPEKKGKDTSGAEAKAQLTFDVDQIRKDSETLLNSFSNAEKIMEARRAAVLINDRDYYAAKLAFLSINSLAQETALQEELARLGKEQLVGKDKIDNQRKIVDAQAKLDKVRENSAANIEVTKIREVAANAKIAQSYVDASNAAQAYIDTVNKQNAREIAGIGKGEEFRTNQAGRNTIEDKQTTQRQGLEGELRRNEIDRTQFDTYLAIVNDTYAKEVQAYDARTAAMKEKQGDWVNGATDAFANYQTKARDVAGNTAAVFTSAFTTLEDGFASSVSKSILHGESFSKSMEGVASAVANEFLTAGVKMAAQWAISQASITSATAVGTATRSTIESAAAAESVLLWAGAAVKNIMTSAWEAMAGAYKAIAGIPYIGPVLAPVAAGAAFIAVAALAKNVAGARALGGPVSAGEMYEVNEKGPELLSAGGKDFLMMGKHSGSVTSNNQLRGNSDAGGGTQDKPGAITIVNNTSAKIGKVTEQRMSNGERALIIEEAVAATAAQFGDPNSKTSRALSRNYATQRSR